jgi:Lon protease-like protein
MTQKPDHKPAPKMLYQTIGEHEYELEDKQLDVFKDITLWHSNPRLFPYLTEGLQSEDEIEASLQRTPGYGNLKTSIADVGQLEHIYVWRGHNEGKYLVLEGATRVTILRELARKNPGNPRFERIKVRILPPHFSEEDKLVLLAQIHVRRSGVRTWGRYIEAKFIFEATDDENGASPKISMSSLARQLGKSQSWISRLRDAYRFARQYVDYVDKPDMEGAKEAVERFSILEEISRCSGFGPRLKGETNDASQLRSEVFDMVEKNVFKEYRDARFMKDFYDDPEKWNLLKTHEQNIAHTLANEIKTRTTSVKGKISNLYKQVERTLATDPDALNEDDLQELERCENLLASHIAADVGPFRLAVQKFVKAVENVSLGEIKRVTNEEFTTLKQGFDYLEEQLAKHAPSVQRNPV